MKEYKVLLLYRVMIPSLILCGDEQFKYLSEHNKLDYRSRTVYEVTAEDLNWANIVVIGRLDSWYERKITEILYKANKYIIYIIDDDLLNLPKEISSSSYYGQNDIRDNIQTMIKMSKALISPSPKILEKYGKDKKKIQIEEPTVYPFSYKAHDVNKAVKIGFAGSIDRTHDVETILYDTLKKIKNKYGEKVEIEFFGAIPSFSKELNAKCTCYSDSYKGYIEKLNSLDWDIGLAPMPDSEFHSCKHYIKIIEYSEVGIYPIYSNQGPYLRFNKEYGLGTMLQNETDAWVKAIEDLIEHRDNLEEQRKYVNEETCKYMSLESCSNKLLEDLDSTVDVSIKSKKVTVNLIVFKGKGFCKRVISASKSRIIRLKQKVLKRV